MRSPSVSVVVPTLGRPELLSRCLEALQTQTLGPEKYEVIVVDDGPSEATRALVEGTRRPGGPQIDYLPTSARHGPAAARNLGWHAARTPVVAFTDDDCVPDPGWLAAGLAAFTDGVAGVSGRLVMPLPAHPTDYDRNAAELQRAEFVTANCFYRRDALALVGGFDERFTAAWREDSDLFFSLLENGARLEREPRAVVVHPVRPAPWGVSLRQQAKTRFNALLFKKHPELYKTRLPTSPRSYYPLTAAAGAALFYGAQGKPRRARVAALVWLAGTLTFAASRLRGTNRRPGHLAEMLITSALIPPISLFWRVAGVIRYRVPHL